MKLAMTMIWMVQSTPLIKNIKIIFFTLLLSFPAKANNQDTVFSSYRSAYFVQNIDAITALSENISTEAMFDRNGEPNEYFWYMFHSMISQNPISVVWADMPVPIGEFILQVEPQIFASGDSFIFICNSLFDAFQLQGLRSEAELILAHCTQRLSATTIISNEYYVGFLARWIYMSGMRGDAVIASRIWDIFSALDTQGWYLDDEQSGITLSLLTEALMFLDQYELLLQVARVASEGDEYRSESVFINNRRRVILAMEVYATLQDRDFPNELSAPVSGVDDNSWNSIFENFIKVVGAISVGSSLDDDTLSLVTSGMRLSGYSTIASAIELNFINSENFTERLLAVLREQERFKFQSLGQLSGSVSITLMDKLFYELVFRAIEAEFSDGLTAYVSEILFSHFAENSFSQVDSFSRIEAVFPNRLDAVSFIVRREQLFERLAMRLWLDVNRRYIFDDVQISSSDELYRLTGSQVEDLIEESVQKFDDFGQLVGDGYNLRELQSGINDGDGIWLIRYLDRRIVSCLTTRQMVECSIRSVSPVEHDEIINLSRTITSLNSDQVLETGRSLRRYFEASVDFEKLKKIKNLYIFSNDYALTPWTIMLADDHRLLFHDTNVSVLASMQLAPPSTNDAFDYNYWGIGDVAYRLVDTLEDGLLEGFPTSSTRGVNLSPLPETAREVLVMAQNFEPNTVRVFLGNDATYENIFGYFGQNEVSTRILHLATHAVGGDPVRGIGRPSIALAATEETNGLISDIRFATANLRAETVILSACSTASDRSISNGAELVGLASSFIVSGAENVVASLWDINSDDTVEYMLEVSSALENEQSVLDALRVARNAMYSRDPGSITSWAGFAHITRLSQ